MKVQKIRYEYFGGIIGTVEPVSLIWADREYLRERGFDGGSAWEGQDPGFLKGPVEMEIAVTSRCNLACSCCYSDAGRQGRDVSGDIVLRALKTASEMDVFHVAFGGGEPLLHPGLIQFGQKARELNLLPTLTTNGSLVDTSWARAARGINIIITASNIHLLPRVFAEGRRAGADSILILRPKPSGRGRKLHKFLHPPASKQRELLPMLLELGNRYQLPFHLDCALAPLMLNSGLPMKTLKLLGGYGCIAGQLLATVDTSGLIHPCSHLDFTVGVVEDLPELWKRNELWKGFRDRASILKGKCSRCPVRELCRGGCAVFNQHNNLGFDEPDPDIACC